MFLENCYNEFVDFTEWINRKFVEWRGDSRQGVTDFANYLEINQPLVSKWLNGRSRKGPDTSSVAKLADKFPDVYEVVGLPQPPSRLNYLPRTFRRRLERAQAETERIFRERGLTGEMPEAEQVAIEVFEKYGFIYMETKIEPD